jgi:proline iminopeptidase
LGNDTQTTAAPEDIEAVEGTGVKRDSVHIDDATLSYTTEGVGIPLLVVGSSIYYPRTFSQQLKRTYALVCADLPHFVQLNPEFRLESISFDLYARCIESIRTAAGLDRVVIVGHSHHGNIALEYAKRHPRKVSHIVLIGSPPVDIAHTVKGSEQYWMSHASKDRKAILQDRRSSIDEGYLASLSPQEAYVAQYVADAPLYWHNPTYDAAWLWQDMAFSMEAIHAFRDLYQVYDLNWDAQSLQAPMLVVMGRDDYAVPHQLWESVLPKLKNVTFRVLGRSGHTPQLEEPEVFDRVLLNWLQNDDKRIP